MLKIIEVLSRGLILYLLLLPILGALPLFAEEEKALNAMQEGVSFTEKGDWLAAAKKFSAGELYSDDPVKKANALKQTASSYRKANMLYKEYVCLKKLIDVYPDQIHFEKVVEREYAIGNSFAEGYRECPYTWFPWLEDEDRTIDIYETILLQAPFALFIPEMMLKMGEIYTKASNYKKAEEIYKKLIRAYPISEHTGTAYLELGHLNVELSKTGDGDGAYVHSAKLTLDEYLKKYSTSSEVPWAKEALEKAENNVSKSLYDLALYYHKNNNDDAAKRYIREIIVNYPKTEAASKADKLLSKIDVWRYPNETVKTEKKTYRTDEMPEETDEPLVVPGQGTTKWLLPLPDLGIEKKEELKSGVKEHDDTY